jgi:hypothetical protein
VLAYRDAIRSVAGGVLRREIEQRLAATATSTCAASSSALSLLLLAAELETALADLSWPAHDAARRFTDACAAAWWQRRVLNVEHWRRELDAMPLPDRLALKRPEGYAYYALDPAAYARAVLELAAAGTRLVIVGVRSIGTSLSAVALAAARTGGYLATRLTLRPTGHAWDRRCSFDAHAREGWLDASADYLILDEGPGLSGSTFLAVAEGIEAAGVARERITLVTSHAVDPARLVARDAAARWSRFRVRTAPQHGAPSEGPDPALDVSGGRWRQHVFASEREWPFVWTATERRKLLVPARSQLMKFVGLPPYGEGPLARGRALAAAGFSPPLEAIDGGYVSQRWAVGVVRRSPRCLATPEFLDHVVEYLAFRSRAFPADAADPAELDAMMRQNVREALGIELPEQRLELRQGVFADARMQPHEWVASAGATLKVDATDHGDDHGFPGPCDSAWDVAGAIVELGLEPARADAFLARYQRRTGDDVRGRLGPYLVAYAAERVGRLHTAALSTSSDEKARLERELRRYSERLRVLVRRHFDAHSSGLDRGVAAG